MADRFAALRALPRPGDAVTVWVETDAEAVHFLDAAFSGLNGIANVRREYRDDGARKLFRVYVAPGCLDDVRRALRTAARFVTIGEVQVEQ
ncbi:TPA: hypothetical protein DCY67_05005 [Candidatus Acetothermia bacterium]|nr:hypothetical protein [Candidatus Acetothermia bacterium]